MLISLRQKLIPLLLAVGILSSEAEEVVLAKWHDFSAAYQAYRWSGQALENSSELKQVTGKLWGGDGARNTWGSTDGTFGDELPVGSATADGAMSIRVDRSIIQILVTNSGPGSIRLNRLLFDFSSVSINAPRNLTFLYASGDLDIADGHVIRQMTGLANGLSNVAHYEDEEINLTSLADRTLASGEQATFHFVADTANVNNQAMALDNIALLGEAVDLRVLTYNIHGGEGANGEGDLVSNITAFRNDFMQGEDIVCLQEVDDWPATQALFPEYPHTYLATNTTTAFIWPWQTRPETSLAILSKYPFTSTHQQIIQIDPQVDRWERHAQHVTINYAGQPLHIFHYHNTYNFFENNYQSEREGLEKFRDYVLARLSITSLSEAPRVIMLGDFNVLQANVTAILNPSSRRSNGLDHVTSMSHHLGGGTYATAAQTLSDHNAVWAVYDLAAPQPVTPVIISSDQQENAVTLFTQETTDASGVEYFFKNLSFSDGSHDSGWQASPTFQDLGLTVGQSYQYKVTARDLSNNQNTTESSAIWTHLVDDGDALPGEWEILYFGNLNTSAGSANEDFDQDGKTDLEEYIAGTNPTDKGSLFESWTTQSSNGQFQLHWNAVAGKSYDIEVCSDLSPQDWESLVEDVTATPPENSYLFNDDAAKRFYRVKVKAESN